MLEAWIGMHWYENVRGHKEGRVQKSLCANFRAKDKLPISHNSYKDTVGELDYSQVTASRKQDLSPLLGRLWLIWLEHAITCFHTHNFRTIICMGLRMHRGCFLKS